MSEFKPVVFSKTSPAIPMEGLSEATPEGTGKDFSGLEDLGEVILKCPSCDRNVVKIQIVSTKKETTFGNQVLSNKRKYYGECPCGDTTFPKEIEGEVYLDACEPLIMADMKYDTDTNKVTVITQDVKK